MADKSGKDKFYKLLNLSSEDRKLMKFYKKIKKAMEEEKK